MVVTNIIRAMPGGRLSLLHVIHDFLPRHQAGSEIYAFELSRELAQRQHVQVLCAEFDPSRPHGHVTWRVHEGLAVIEIVNNWQCATFEETYRPPLIAEQIGHVLRAVQPDVVHVHNLLNFSFDLPAMARRHGSAVVATLHDYTLVCPSGGQRIHRAEHHVCHVIDTDRCARCFRESPFHAQISFGRVAALAPRLLTRVAAGVAKRTPLLANRLASGVSRMGAFPISADEIEARLRSARTVFEAVDLFVAPSQSIASEFARLGIDQSKIRVSDNGFVPMQHSSAKKKGERLRIGYVGTLVWHKGVHVLMDAVRELPGAAYELTIFGSLETHPEYSAQLRSQAAGLPVRFRGRFERAQVTEVYAQLDVLVVPSLWLENSPLVIHEAFMAGVPVVGARIGGIAELVNHGLNGLLYDPASPADLTAALRQLIDHPERLREFARQIPEVKTIARDALDWEAAYADVLQRRAMSGPRG